MVNHYTSFKKRRHQDAYTPGGGFSGRPNRPTIVYSNLIRKTYKKTPILLGGIEASLRRLAHYDYWSDKVKRSVLLDSGADLLMYGMGEHSILEIAEALDSGIAVQDITYIRGTVFKCRDLEELPVIMNFCRPMKRLQSPKRLLPKLLSPVCEYGCNHGKKTGGTV